VRAGATENDAREPARWLCGTFTIGDPQACHLLASLPAVIILRGARGPALEGLEGLEVCRPQDARIRDAIAWTPPLTCSAAPPFRSRSSRRTSATRRRRHSAGRSRTATARHRLTGDETHERSTRERPKCRDVAPSSRGGAGEEPAAEIAWVVRTPPWQGQPSAAVAALLTLTGQLQDGEMRWRLIMTPSSDRRSTSGAIPRPSRGGTAGGRRRRAGRWRA